MLKDMFRGNGRHAPADQAATAQADLFDPSTAQLVRYDRARQALREARDIDDVLDIHDKAQAAAVYARLAGDTELIDHAMEIKKRAEIRAGEVLIEMRETGDRADQGGDRRSKSQAATLKLSDIGISKSESSRWQQAARLPAEEQEAMIAAAKRKAKTKRKQSDTSQEDAFDVCIDAVETAVRRALRKIEPARHKRLARSLHGLVDDLVGSERETAAKKKAPAAKARAKSKPRKRVAKAKAPTENAAERLPPVEPPAAQAS